jgi:histidine triad (HIT) family protein
VSAKPTPHSCWNCKDADPAVCLANPAHPHYNKGLVYFPERVAKPGCPFCDIIAGHAPATVVQEWDDVIAIAPRNPVVDGHTLVIPKSHVEDFAAAAHVASRTMSKASILAHRMGGPMNLITSKGPEATQSVFHLHVHLVPRAVDDGLALPWASGYVDLTSCEDKRAAFQHGYDRGQERQKMRTAEHVVWLQATVAELRKAAGPMEGETDPRQAAYDAVFAHLRKQPVDFMPTTVVDRNAMIWHAVHAALDAIGVPKKED